MRIAEIDRAFQLFPTWQRSRSRGSFIHMPSLPVDDARRNSALSVDELLDTNDAPPGAVLNPEPLWQLEFGSCWHRMRAETPAAASPRGGDVVLDLGSDTESSASSSVKSLVSERSITPRPPASLIDIPPFPEQSRQASRAEKRSPDAPYFPDWEIQMLAESMDKSDDDDDDFLVDEAARGSSPEPVPAEMVRQSARRGRTYLRSSSSVDPQAKGSVRSRQMIENWHWSYPPPHQPGVDEEDEPD